VPGAPAGGGGQWSVKLKTFIEKCAQTRESEALASQSHLHKY
jgi:hypothetical protein